MNLFYYNFINYKKANRDKWMTIPDMGYAIANRYNVILVYLSSVQNLTIFSLCTSPPSTHSQHWLISIRHVHGYHFVQVKWFINFYQLFSLLTNYMFKGLTTRRLSYINGGYDTIQQLLPQGKSVDIVLC